MSANPRSVVGCLVRAGSVGGSGASSVAWTTSVPSIMCMPQMKLKLPARSAGIAAIVRSKAGRQRCDREVGEHDSRRTVARLLAVDDHGLLPTAIRSVWATGRSRGGTGARRRPALSADDDCDVTSTHHSLRVADTVENAAARAAGVPQQPRTRRRANPSGAPPLERMVGFCVAVIRRGYGTRAP